MKYITNLILDIQVESQNWVVEADMLNQVHGFTTDLWWNIWNKNGMHIPIVKEMVKTVTLAEALRLTIDSVKPVHQHDCSHCTFLGLFQADAIVYDLYHCEQLGNPTVIARFGEDGEYYSGLPLVDKMRVLGAARDRAKILGLL